MTSDDVRTASLTLIGLDAGMLGVVVTLVALLPALTEAAFSNATSDYHTAVRATDVRRRLRALRLLIPLLAISTVGSMLLWALETRTLLYVVTTATVVSLVWLSAAGYLISKDLGRYLLSEPP